MDRREAFALLPCEPLPFEGGAERFNRVSRSSGSRRKWLVLPDESRCVVAQATGHSHLFVRVRGGTMERLALAAISIALILVAAAACNTGDRVVAIVDDPGPGPGPLPPGNVPQLTVSEVHHSFGGVEVGASATATFRISNAGSGTAGPLAPALAGGGKSFVTDGACAGRSLGPGAWCEVRVTFRPEAFGRKEAALAIAESLSGALEGYGRGPGKPALQSTG